MRRTWRKLATSSTKSWGRSKKKRMRTSKEMSSTMARVARPATVAAARDSRAITAEGRSASQRLEGQLHAPLAVGAGAPEPEVPGPLGQLAGLLDLLPGRIDDGHAQLDQTLARAVVPGLGVLPFL